MRIIKRIRNCLATPPDPFRVSPKGQTIVYDLCRHGRVLNLGSGHSLYTGPVVNLDLVAGYGVHVCGDGHHLPFGDAAFQSVLLRGVLEHVRCAMTVLNEVRRVLVDSGMLYVEVPFLQPLHLSPEDHRRFTLPGLRSFFSDFEEVQSGVQIGSWSTVAWVLREATADLLCFGSESVNRRILAIAGWCSFWVRELDRLIVMRDHSTRAASALYYLGRKRH